MMPDRSAAAASVVPVETIVSAASVCANVPATMTVPAETIVSAASVCANTAPAGTVPVATIVSAASVCAKSATLAARPAKLNRGTSNSGSRHGPQGSRAHATISLAGTVVFENRTAAMSAPALCALRSMFPSRKVPLPAVGAVAFVLLLVKNTPVSILTVIAVMVRFFARLNTSR